MDKVIAAIEERLNTLDGHIGRLEKSVKSRGEGCIWASRSHGCVRFYEKKGTREKRYLGNDDQKTIQRLIQKKYETKLLEAAENEKRILNECLELLTSKRDKSDMNAVFPSLTEEIKKYVRQDESTDEGFAQKWLAAKYYRAKRGEGHKFETLNKDLVRSKSEVIIADRLYTAGIPYRYEQMLELQNEHANPLRYYPDFTVLNKRTRKIYYWEHLGRLGDPEYCFDTLIKLEDYSDNGILFGKNLILTFESQKMPLYTANVDRLIKQFLI